MEHPRREAQGADFSLQLQARRAGARLLLDAPVDVGRLLGELAGLAWMPRAPYRVLLLDAAAGLEDRAALLRNAGCEVLASADPLAIWERVPAFAPETCVVSVNLPTCFGSDFVALLRRDKRFTRLPVLYLATSDDPEHALAARYAGGEEYFAAPVDPRLLDGGRGGAGAPVSTLRGRLLPAAAGLVRVD